MEDLCEGKNVSQMFADTFETFECVIVIFVNNWFEKIFKFYKFKYF